MNLWTWRQILHGKNRQTSWCVTRGVNFQAHGFVAGQGAPCEAWPLTRLKGLDKKLAMLEISINTSELELLVKITFEAEIVTLTFVKMNSGLNRRINNPCRISSACRLGGLKTVWRGTRKPYGSLKRKSTKKEESHQFEVREAGSDHFTFKNSYIYIYAPWKSNYHSL